MTLNKKTSCVLPRYDGVLLWRGVFSTFSTPKIPQPMVEHGISGGFSFMIMHTFADWGRAGHNMVERVKITTV